MVRSVCGERTQQVEQSWTMQQPLACQEPDVTILAAVEKSRSRMLLKNPPYHVGSIGESSMVVFLGTRRYHLGSSGGNSMAPASRKPTLPSWQRWGKLHGACFQEPDVTILATVEETRWRMLLENPRYHLRSDGESSMVVFLGTRRYHLGSSGGNSMAPASRKPTLPSWQRWGKLHGGISRNPTLPSWQQ